MALLWRLFALVAVALLPAIAIQFYNEFDFRTVRKLEVQNQALGLAKLAAADQEQIVQGIRQVLIALSELPAIKAKDQQACSTYLSALKRRYPAFLSFYVVDTNGHSFCAANDTSINVSDRPYFADAISTANFTVGDFTVGRTTRRNLIPFALPFLGDDGRMRGVIVATLGLDWLADFLAQMDAPPGTTLAIADRKGTYLARYPDNAEFVGRSMPGHLRLGNFGTIADQDPTGVERIVGYSTLQAASGELLVTVGLDKKQAFRAIERRIWRDVLLTGLGTILALILTWFGARRFVHQPLQQLVDAANQWRLGDYARRVHTADKCPELSWVAEAFNTMANSLADRERELCEAKERAEKAAARITTIFESTTDCVIIVDPEWRITYRNERAQVQLSQDHHNLVGMKLWEAFADDLDLTSSAQLQDAASEQRSVSFEKLCARRDVWYEINAFPSGEGLAILLRNVTEHRQAVRARRLIEEQLQQSQKMEAVGQLTGGIAHDFNNMLMVISANLELIACPSTEQTRVRQLAVASQKAAVRGTTLTAQLLAFSRRQKLNPKPVYADSLIRDFEELIRRAMGEQCELTIDADDQLWSCYVDPAQLQTALLNLALNGRDAMPKSGILKIELRNVTLDEGAIAGVPPGSYVRLSVSDTGCGMPPEILAKAFEPFFTTKDVGKGTGLGLSMVYGFVRQSGGHVTIKSSVAVGTTVSLYLPKSTRDPALEDRVAEAREIEIGSGRVLLVEDDDDVLDVTVTMLRNLGYQVLSARNAAEALHTLKSDKHFDILFSDIVMPHGINGIELAREARQLCKDLKILLMSGNATAALSRNEAADEFSIISKPFRRAELAEFLRVASRDT